MIGIGILKIDSEIAEIFEVKDGTRHLEIDILPEMHIFGNFGRSGSQSGDLEISPQRSGSQSTDWEIFPQRSQGEFWIIQHICYQMDTEILKIQEEMTEKMKPEVANPP